MFFLDLSIPKVVILRMTGRFQSLSLPSLEMTDNTFTTQCLCCSLNREDAVVDPMYLFILLFSCISTGKTYHSSISGSCETFLSGSSSLCKKVAFPVHISLCSEWHFHAHSSFTLKESLISILVLTYESSYQKRRCSIWGNSVNLI